MALCLRLSSVQGRFKSAVNSLRIAFRGQCYNQEFRSESNGAHVIILDKDFEWLLRSELCETDSLSFQLFSRRFGSKPYGVIRVYLKGLLDTGFLNLTEAFCDSNHAPLAVELEFLLSYQSVGAAGAADSAEETMGLLSGAEGAVASLEDRLSRKSSTSTRKADAVARKPSSAGAKIRSLWGGGRGVRRKARASESSDASEEGGVGSETLTFPVEESDSNWARPESAKGSRLEASRDDSAGSGRRQRSPRAYSPTPAVQDFQVAVTLIEAKLSGPNIDPVVCIQVGDQKRYSSEKLATHCPYFNEYFVFDFRMAVSSFMDQLIVLTVFQSRKILRPTEVFGSFKMDVATVYGQKDRQFHHKWAVLMDSDDMLVGAKGYLKVSIAVSGKGETIRAPLKPEKEDEEDNVEANLLLPAGVSGDRQQARYIFRLYSAEGTG